MAKTSSHTQPVKATSEDHNLRKIKLKNVREDLSHKNQSFIKNEISPTLKEIKNLYKKTTGQKMQTKATPIRESVIVIDETVTMDKLKNLGEALESQFGIRTMQIHMHDDEGHVDKKTKEWKKNRHAHMVFNWTEPQTGKTIKLNRLHMSEMQTTVAKILGMERGASSDTKHLNAVQYKNKIEAEKLQQLKKEKQEILKNSAVKGFSKLVGMDADKKKIKSLETDRDTAINAFDKLANSYRVVQEENAVLEERVSTLAEGYEMKENEALFYHDENNKLSSDLEHEKKEKEKFKKWYETVKNNHEFLKESLVKAQFINEPKMKESAVKAQKHVDKIRKEKTIEMVKVLEKANLLVEQKENKKAKGKGQSLGGR